MSLRVVPVAAIFLVACASNPARAVVAHEQSQPAAAEAPPPQKTPAFDKDTTQASAHGTATFSVPAGWSLVREADVTRIVAPEGDEPVAIVDVAAGSWDESVAAAWKALGRTPAWRVASVADIPAREGWQGGRVSAYDAPPNAKHTLTAVALGADNRNIVMIIDTQTALFEKRVSQLALIDESLRPSGFQRESFAGRSAHDLDAKRLEKLDELVALAQRELEIPGIALAIAQGSKVIQLRGYGVRQQDKPEKVDADTLFMVASNTKALTTLLLAQLVDDGKLRWDEPVIEALPSFRIGDDQSTRALQIKHLICACTGLPRQDWEWLLEFDKAQPSDVMSALAGLQPTTQLGATFQYSNQLAAAAGFVAASVLYKGRELGSAYDTAMRERIFTPLDMRQSTFDFARAARSDHASAHGWNADGKLELIDPRLNRSAIPVRPAAGLWSSAREMIRYVQLELAGGVVPGTSRRIVSEANLRARAAPQVQIGEHGTYGMGLMTFTKHGVSVVGHDGGMFGFRSVMFWLPEHNVGAVVLTNSDYGQLLLNVFQRALLEQLFDGKPEAAEDLSVAAQNFKKELASEREKLTIPAEPALVSALAARYSEPKLGTLAIKQVKGVATLDVGEWQSPIGTRKNDDGSTSLVTIGPGVNFAFVVGEAADRKRTLTARDAQHEYTFVEAP